MASRGLIHGPLGENSVHICVDMQRLFEPGAPWAMPWIEKVLPLIVDLTSRHAERTVFTRFIPAASAEDAPGMWAAYYRRWANLTLTSDRQRGLLELVPALVRLCALCQGYRQARLLALDRGNLGCAAGWIGREHPRYYRRRNRCMRPGYRPRCDRPRL